MDMKDLESVRALKSNLSATFDSPQGKEAMLFMERIGAWYPTIFDANDTNAIIARDANRRLIGTIKTVLRLSPEQIVKMAEQADNQ